MKRLLLGISLISFTIGGTSLVIPLYANSLGASYTDIGMLGVAYIVLAAVFSITLGKLSDSHGRRVFIVTGFITTAAVLTMYSFAPSIIWLIAIRAVQGLTETLIWINSQGAASDSSNLAERGRAMGLYGRSWGVGMGFGPVVAGVLYASIGPFYTFLINGGLSFVAAAIVFTATIPQTRPVQKKISTTGVMPLFFAGLTYMGVVAVITTILPVYSTAGLGLSAFYAGLLITIFTLLRAVLFKPFGEISDRVGHRSTILAGVILASLALASFIFVSGLVTLLIVLIVLAISASSIYPSVFSAISKIGAGGNFGYLLGIFNLITNVGWGVFSGASGALADAYGPTSSFVIYGVVVLMSAVILWKTLPKN